MRRVATLLLVGALPAGAVRADGGIVVAAPLSGSASHVGTTMTAAASEAGAELGIAIALEDDGCRADSASALAATIVARKPEVVIGHPCSSAAIAAAPYYAAAGIPFIATGGARHPDLTDKRAGPLVFRLAGRDDRQGQAAADFLARAADGKAIAILQDRTFAMSSIALATEARLSGPPGQGPANNVRQFPFVASELNYDDLVAKVLAYAGTPDQVGAIFFAGFPAECVVLLRALRARGVTAPLLGVEAVATPELSEELGKMRDVFVLRSNPGPDAAGAAASATRAAVNLWQLARRKSPEAANDAIRGVVYDDPVLGHIAFDDHGDVTLPSYVVSAWQTGRWVPLAATGAGKLPLP